VAKWLYAHDSKSCGEIRGGSTPLPGTMKRLKRYKPRKRQNFVWTKDLAYIVGLIVTDGCLSKDGRHVIFTSKDIEQIGNFIRILKIKNKIGITKNKTGEAYRIQIGNVQFYDWLLEIGLTAKKSLTLGKINIPDNYFLDFLRGHLDGDGSITTYIDKYNTRKDIKYIYKRICTSFISASEDHIIWLRQSIIKIAKVNGSLHKSKTRKGGKNPMYVIKFGKKESLNLLSNIYYSNDIPYLTRKKLKYDKFLK
jgi:hypothetical protein